MTFEEVFLKLESFYRSASDNGPVIMGSTPTVDGVGFRGDISAGANKPINGNMFPNSEDIQNLKRAKKFLKNRNKRCKNRTCQKS